MIEQQITLCSNGRAVLSGYSGGLLLGYAHNTGVYRLRVVCSGEWDGTTVAAFWHLPGSGRPLTTLVADGAVEVPALVTAQGGSGTVTFEGSDGTRTVTSASVPYRVLTNSGTTDPTLPEPGTPGLAAVFAAGQAGASQRRIRPVRRGARAHPCAVPPRRLRQRRDAAPL